MSIEQEPRSNEALSERNLAELGQLARSPETSPETATDSAENRQQQVEVARAKIEQHAVERPSFEEKAPKPKHHITRRDKLIAYRQTLKSLQARLSPSSRSFSKVIHQPTIEKTSEVLGKTIFRPSITLGATLTAVIFESILYFTARHYGFALRGSEVLLALLAGAIIGLILEAVSKLFRRKQL